MAHVIFFVVYTDDDLGMSISMSKKCILTSLHDFLEDIRLLFVTQETVKETSNNDLQKIGTYTLPNKVSK